MYNIPQRSAPRQAGTPTRNSIIIARMRDKRPKSTAKPKPIQESPGDGEEAAARPRIIGGKFRGRRLLYEPHLRTRPMKDRVREAVFNLIGPGIQFSHAIDLFAGTGGAGVRGPQPRSRERDVRRAPFSDRRIDSPQRGGVGHFGGRDGLSGERIALVAPLAAVAGRALDGVLFAPLESLRRTSGGSSGPVGNAFGSSRPPEACLSSKPTCNSTSAGCPRPTIGPRGVSAGGGELTVAMLTVEGGPKP